MCGNNSAPTRDLLSTSGYELVERLVGGARGGGDGLLFQEPGSKASFSTSFTPRNPKYCLGALCRVQFETCNHNFSDSQLQGSILIRQMCSRKKSKTGVNRWKKRRHRKGAGGRAGRADTADLCRNAKH